MVGAPETGVDWEPFPLSCYRFLSVVIWTVLRKQRFEDIWQSSPTTLAAFLGAERTFSNPQRCRPGLGASAPAWASPWVRSGAAWLPSLARFQTLRRICLWRARRKWKVTAGAMEGGVYWDPGSVRLVLKSICHETQTGLEKCHSALFSLHFSFCPLSDFL